MAIKEFIETFDFDPIQSFFEIAGEFEEKVESEGYNIYVFKGIKEKKLLDVLEKIVGKIKTSNITEKDSFAIEEEGERKSFEFEGFNIVLQIEKEENEVAYVGLSIEKGGVLFEVDSGYGETYVRAGFDDDKLIFAAYDEEREEIKKKLLDLS